jgi:hypothetical protein
MTPVYYFDLKTKKIVRFHFCGNPIQSALWENCGERKIRKNCRPGNGWVGSWMLAMMAIIYYILAMIVNINMG